MTLSRTPEVPYDEGTVTVKLWEAYLRYNNAHLYRILSDLCLEEATTEQEHQSERVTFRFSRRLWEGKVKQILEENRIPVTLRSPRSSLVRSSQHSLN